MVRFPNRTIGINLGFLPHVERVFKPDFTLLEWFPNPDFREIGQKSGLGKALQQ